MGTWHRTGCVLCAQNCGLKILVENGRMTRVVPDRENPRSLGYVCRKGMNVLYHQYQKDRLTHPLKKVNGTFERVSWDQAVAEIADRMRAVAALHGPRSMAYVGGSSQGGHMEAGFGLGLLRAMGSQNYYSSAGQEFSGAWWTAGRVMGKQYNISIPDEDRTEMLVAWGWNGMESHQMPRAPLTLAKISKDPDRTLVAIDPRKSETARMANIHLALRPGTDALLIKAMIALIVKEGWENGRYLDTCVDGWDKVRSWFTDVDIPNALGVCRLEMAPVRELCRLMARKRWSFHQDLGIYMGRHSTLNSYLLYILGAVCGIFQRPGGNVIPGMVMPMGFHADERNDRVWRTQATNMPPAAAGAFPPAVLTEEILSDHPGRIRSVYVSACNPLRAYPDTTAFERAFKKLDLLVVNDIVMSETAALADYVLPCRSFYESWDTTFFPWTYPKVYSQLRRPLVEPPGECLEASQVFTLLADRLGLIPNIPDTLFRAAKGDRMAFGGKLMTWASTEPRAMKAMPFILAKTLGKEWDSSAKAGLWGMLMTAPRQFRENAARAGFEPDLGQGDAIFQALVDNPQGLWVGEADVNAPMKYVKTPSGKLEIHIQELAEAAERLTPEREAADLRPQENFPMILSAGRHFKYTINSLMRNPEWNRGKRDCTVAVNPSDAEALNLADGDLAEITTEAGSAILEVEITDMAAKGMVLIPHGFGYTFDGKVRGVNVNRLTRSTHRDPIGTPLHRYIPCRIKPAGGQNSAED